MATKRGHQDIDADDSIANHQDGAQTNDRGGPSAKRRKQFGKTKHKPKEGSIEYAKKRVRAIERVFQKNQDLPADVRNNMERELAAHKASAEEKKFQKRRKDMISKYHMVRFFERKKAMRRIKQLKGKITSTTDAEELKKLQQDLHVAEVDEAYTQHHPHAEPYLSLYGKSKGDQEGEASTTTDETARPPLWAAVEKAMKEGDGALRNLRERRSPDDSTASTTTSTKPKNATKNPTNKPREKSERSEKSEKKASEPRKEQAQKPSSAPNKPSGGANGVKPGMNRRERRKLMRENAAAAAEEDDGEGFFE